MCSAALALLFLLPAAGWPQEDLPFFRNPRHDFGPVPRGAIVSHRFAWTNHTASRRQIMEVRPNCGCAAATPVPAVLEPGQSGFIDVVVDTRRLVGPKTVIVHVLVGPVDPKAIVLQAEIVSRTDVVFNPGLAQFGVVSQGSRARANVDIEYAGALDWRILSVAAESPALEAHLEESYRRPGQVGYRVEVALAPQAAAGDLREEVILRTNDPESPVIRLRVEATVRPAVSVAPSPIDFGVVAPGQTAWRRIAIRGGSPLRLVRVEGTCAGLEVEVLEPAGPTRQALLRWRPAEETSLDRELRFITDAGECRLRVRGEARKEKSR